MANFSKQINEIEKCLEMFKNAREWSDFMSHLAYLDDLLKKFPKGITLRELPIHTLNKRLNQCLSPSLPAGVHNEVINTYSILIGKFQIFIKDINNEERRADEVNFFFVNILSGLFNFTRFSKMQSKKNLYDLFEFQLLKLDINLESYIRNILLGLFPGLEEDSEISQRCNLIILQLYEKANLHSFWTHLWNVFLVCKTHRLSIVNFLTNNLQLVKDLKTDKRRNNKEKGKSIFYFLSEMMVVHCIKAGLIDTNTIVVRGTLDLLMMFFVIEKLTRSNQIIVLKELLHLLTYRDIGLNKRIDSFIDKNGEKLKIVIERNAAYKINSTNITKDEIIYDKMSIALEMYVIKDNNQLLEFFKILSIINDRDDLFDYLIIRTLVKGMNQMYENRDELGFELVLKRFNTFCVNSDVWFIWFLIIDYINSLVKKQEKSRGIFNANEKKNEQSMQYIMHYNAVNRSLDELRKLKEVNEKAGLNNKTTEMKYDADYTKNIEDIGKTAEKEISQNEVCTTDKYKVEGNNEDNIIVNVVEYDALLENAGNSDLKYEKQNLETSYGKNNEQVMLCDNFLGMVKFLIEKTALRKEEATQVHLIMLCTLLLDCYEFFTPIKINEFLIVTLENYEFLKIGEGIPFNILYDCIIDFYNNENEVKMYQVHDAFVKTFGMKLVQLFNNKENFLSNNNILLFFVEKYDIIHINPSFFYEYYLLVCDYTIHNDTDAKLLDSSIFILSKLQSHPEFNKIISKSEILLDILLAQKNHQYLCKFNILFNRIYEFRMIEYFKNKINIPLILKHLKFCIHNDVDNLFYNILFVITIEYKNQTICTPQDEKEISALYKFYHGIQNFNYLIPFIIFIMHNTIEGYSPEKMVVPENPKYIIMDEPALLASLATIEVFLDLSTAFKHFLLSDTEILYEGCENSTKSNIFLYKVFINFFCIGSIEIQIKIMNLINTLYSKNIITSADLELIDFTEFIKYFNSQVKNTVIWISIKTFTILYNNKMPDISNAVFHILYNTKTVGFCNNEIINMILEFRDDKMKGLLMEKYLKESESLKKKYLILKNIVENKELFEVLQYKDIINHMISTLLCNTEKLVKAKNLNMDAIRADFVDCRQMQQINEITLFLISREPITYILNIMTSGKDSNYLRYIFCKPDIYRLLCNDLTDNSFSFLLSFETNCDMETLSICHDKFFSHIIEFYINQRNKLLIFEFYFWFFNRVKILPKILDSWSDVCKKILESINLLINKCLYGSLKRFKTEGEKNEFICRMLQKTPSLYILLHAEKYKYEISAFTSTLFLIIKNKDGKIFDSALMNIHEISKKEEFVRFYKREYFEYLYDSKFFIETPENFTIKVDIMKNAIANDTSVIIQLFDTFEPAKFFKLNSTDFSRRKELLRRLSFLFFSGLKNHFSGFIPLVLEKMVDSLNSGQDVLKREVYFLIRQIAFKTDSEKLSILWPTVSSDINMFFERVVNDKISKHELPLLVEVVKTIDLIFTLKLDSFIEFKWACTETYDYIKENRINDEIIEKQESLQNEINLETINDNSGKGIETRAGRVHRNIEGNPESYRSNRKHNYIDDKELVNEDIKPLENNEISADITLANENHSLGYFSRIAGYIRVVKKLPFIKNLKRGIVKITKRKPSIIARDVYTLKDLLPLFSGLSMYHKNMDLFAHEIDDETFYMLTVQDFLNEYTK